MRIGSLFSGIGGLELGLEMSGIGHTAWQVEQSEFCRGVLSKHWPDVERFEDVREVGRHNLAPVDVLCGGFPCQDISSAGKGAGLAGERSGLWFEFARVIDELGPAWVVVENVASGAARWVDPVRSHLEQLGYETLPVPISAQDVGAPHLRRRIFIVAHAHGEQLREQPRWGERAQGQNEALTGVNGGARAIGDADRDREPARAGNAEVAGVPVVQSGSSAWKTKPGIFGMGDGVPHRMDRCRSLGNAVVPQCAEVVGWIIRELLAGKA